MRVCAATGLLRRVVDEVCTAIKEGRDPSAQEKKVRPSAAAVPKGLGVGVIGCSDREV